MAEQRSGEDALLRILEDPEIKAAGQQPEDTTAHPVDAPPFSIGALPPELLGKLPALMSALGPMLSGKVSAKDEKSTLLLALKPYMSPQRCDAIDKLIMLGNLSELMRQLHLGG